MTDADTTELDNETEAPAEDLAEGAEGATEPEAEETDDLEERLVAEGEIAGDYLEEVLDLLEFDGDIDLDVEGSRAIVGRDGSDDMNRVIGRTGAGPAALQETTRLAVARKTVASR